MKDIADCTGFIYAVVKELMLLVSRLACCFKRLDHGSSMRLPVMTRFWGLVGLVLGCIHHQHVTTTPRHHTTRFGGDPDGYKVTPQMSYSHHCDKEA